MDTCLINAVRQFRALKRNFFCPRHLSNLMKHGGDDLEDDFVLDDIVALSGDEAPCAARFDDEDIFVDDDAEEEEDDTDEVALPAPTTLSGDLTASAKKRKRREKEKERKVSSSDVC